MKNILLLIIATVLFVNTGCKKEDPEILDITDLASVTLSENFIAQPVTTNTSLVGIITRNENIYLASYDAEGNKNWMQDIGAYTLGGISYQEVFFLDLRQGFQNEFLVNMYQPTENITHQYVKAVKFDQNGSFLWQLTDTIHQPDTLFMGPDTIPLPGKYFIPGDFLNFSDGGYGVISSLDSASIDSTFIQLTRYNANGQFNGNRYYKINTQFSIANAYLTSSNTIFMLTGSPLGERSILILDLQQNFWERETTQDFLILDIYMFYENSQGDYIISASAFIGGSDVARGIITCLGPNVEEKWSIISDLQPNSGFMRSVNERSDGYIFTGLSSNSAIFDWRDNTASDNRAIIQRVDLNGIPQGETLTITSPWFQSVA
jgi:hypothetical protein